MILETGGMDVCETFFLALGYRISRILRIQFLSKIFKDYYVNCHQKKLSTFRALYTCIKYVGSWRFKVLHQYLVMNSPANGHTHGVECA